MTEDDFNQHEFDQWRTKRYRERLKIIVRALRKALARKQKP